MPGSTPASGREGEERRHSLVLRILFVPRVETPSSARMRWSRRLADVGRCRWCRRPRWHGHAPDTGALGHWGIGAPSPPWRWVDFPHSQSARRIRRRPHRTVQRCAHLHLQRHLETTAIVPCGETRTECRLIEYQHGGSLPSACLQEPCGGRGRPCTLRGP